MIVNNLMSDFWDGKLTKVDLLKQKISFDEIENALDYSLRKKDASTVENALFLANMFNFFDNSKDLYSALIKEGWHREHEDIARLFQFTFNQKRENIEVLVSALYTIPNYLQSDDFKFPYIRKIIYAIGAQPEPYNIQALEKIAQSEDEKIRELALHQIEKRKRLGRWEAESNK